MGEAGRAGDAAAEAGDAAAEMGLARLPEELHRGILLRADAAMLPRASCVCVLWHGLTAGAAEERLRRRRPWLATEARCPCWVRSLATLEMQLEGSVGASPSGRTWEDENVALREEACVQWWTITLAEVVAHSWVRTKIAAGWDAQHARALAGLHGLHAPLGAASRERSGRFAASARASLDASFATAVRPERGPSPAALYANLEGEDGLAAVEPAWLPNRLAALGVGGTFVTSAAIDAKAPLRCLFRDDCGWYAYTARDAFEGDDAFELQDSDLVCFASAPDGARGYRALLLEPRTDAEDDVYLLPPYARVTLERIEAAGEWAVQLADAPERRRPRRRLFTVSVDFGC